MPTNPTQAEEVPVEGPEGSQIEGPGASAATERLGAEERTVPLEDLPPTTDPYKTVHSPYELPANTVAAQMYVNQHPDAVDPEVPIHESRVAQAQEAIQDYQDAVALAVPEDPRLAASAGEARFPLPGEEEGPEGQTAGQQAALGAGDTEEEASYEANTVAELKDELAARNLPVSGNKEELIARLEEDDANTGSQPVQVEGTVSGTVEGTVQEKK